jgi:hypothetical protein
VIPPLVLKFGTIGLILGATYIGGCVRGSQTANKELATYRAQVEAAGRSAQAAADEANARNIKLKEASDASYRTALVALGSDIERMRKSRASTNYLPAKPADSACPEGWACFDRTLLEQALQRLDDGVSGIVAEGDTVRLRLSEAITWANRLNP